MAICVSFQFCNPKKHTTRCHHHRWVVFFGSTQLIKLVLDLSCRTLSCNLRRGGGMHVAQNNRWWMMYTKAAKKEKIELLRLKFLCGLFSPQNLWLSMAIDDAIPLENHQWKHRWGSKFTLSYNICIYLSILSPKSYWCLLNVGLLEGYGGCGRDDYW